MVITKKKILILALYLNKYFINKYLNTLLEKKNENF